LQVDEARRPDDTIWIADWTFDTPGGGYRLDAPGFNSARKMVLLQ
jgi:hypothetical protein